MNTPIIDNFNHIISVIKEVFAFYKLPPKPIQTIVVTKNQPIENIIPLLEDGHRLFGENKVQEAYEKWPQLKERYSDIELHLIGPLQSNKVKKALDLFDAIQVIDRESVIDTLTKHSDLIKPHHQFFIQVNIGNEPQKSGVLVSDFPELLTYAKNHAIKISGLMCIPPQDQDPVNYFMMMQSLCRQNGNLKLSAGMSSDYKQAILCGADYIRIGSAIFL